MPAVASIRWEHAFHAVIPQINADGVLSQTFDPLLPAQVRFYSYDRRRDFRSCRHNYFELFYLSSGDAFRAEFLDLFNRHYLGGIVTNPTRPLFGQVTAVGNKDNTETSRTIQFGMRLDF
jgi:hypothetical protein